MYESYDGFSYHMSYGFLSDIFHTYKVFSCYESFCVSKALTLEQMPIHIKHISNFGPTYVFLYGWLAGFDVQSPFCIFDKHTGANLNGSIYVFSDNFLS